MNRSAVRLWVTALALSVAASSPAWDWNAHKVIGVIAYRHLTPAARAWADAILATNQKGYTDFLNAAPYADYLKRGGPNHDVRVTHKYDHWHFIDYPVQKGQTATVPADTSIERNGDNVLYGMQQSVQNLRTGLPSTRGFYLAMLIHLVGDVHQPLHCAEMNDDGGGNDFRIKHTARNLHALWDDVITLTYKLKGKKGRSDAGIRAVADRVEANYPLASMRPEVNHILARDWALESYALAVTAAYQGIQPGTKPSPAYLARWQSTAERRVALAGYRLAAMLNYLATEKR